MQPIPQPPTAAERAQIRAQLAETGFVPDWNDSIGVEWPTGARMWLWLGTAFVIGVLVGAAIIAVIGGH